MGNARTALVAWLSIRAQGGRFVWRLEDLDGPRTVPGMAQAQMDDLAWLGIDWDEGPGAGGDYGPYEQSRRADHYERALDHLFAAGRLFPCKRSRKDLRGLATAPHGRDGLPPYPPLFRPKHLAPDWLQVLRRNPRPDAAIRFLVDDAPVTFRDRLYGAQHERVAETVGDFVLKRRDGLFAYQLAVVVDDVAMDITEVVRGEDLLASTARQIQLFEALGHAPPTFAHVPLVVTEEGDKLSKRDAGLTLRALREAGIRPEQVIGYVAYSLGFIEEPRAVTARDLVPLFGWERVPLEPWVVRGDVPAQMKEIAT